MKLSDITTGNPTQDLALAIKVRTALNIRIKKYSVELKVLSDAGIIHIEWITKQGGDGPDFTYSNDYCLLYKTTTKWHASGMFASIYINVNHFDRVDEITSFVKKIDRLILKRQGVRAIIQNLSLVPL